MKRFGRIIAVTALILVMAISMSSCATTMGLVLLGESGHLDFSEEQKPEEAVGELEYSYDGVWGGIGPSYKIVGMGSYTDEELIIPSYIEDGEATYPVKAVGSLAFQHEQRITSLVIEDGVELIGYHAFESCRQLREIDLGNVREIRGYAFYRCDHLDNVILPDNSIVGEYAFGGNSYLNIYVPASICHLDFNAFGECEEVNIYYEGTEEEWRELGRVSSWEASSPECVDKVVFDVEDADAMAQAVGESWTDDFEEFFETFLGIIEDMYYSFSEIVEDFFVELGDIFYEIFKPRASEGLEIVRSEDTGMFEVVGMGSCTDEELIIPGETRVDGVEETVCVIADEAFRSEKITSLYIYDGVEHIGYAAFMDCGELSYVDLTNTITHISMFAFAGCTSLEQVSFPKNIVYVADSAFKDDHSLKRVLIPSTIEYLDYFAFDGCSDITVSFTGSVEEWNELAERSGWADEAEFDGNVYYPVGVTAVHTGTSAGKYED